MVIAHPDVAAVVSHDLVNDRQAEAGAATFAREIRKKQSIFVFWFYAGASIRYLDAGCLKVVVV
jgi:hypothetical protein